MRLRRIPYACLIPSVALLVIGSNMALSADVAAFDPLPGAEQRIKEHRCAPATILVLDAAGKPVPNAKLEVRQTRHAFLFGCNIFKWQIADAKLQDAYRERYADLLNFATIGFYWWAYEPAQGKPRHEYAESVARWCQEKGISCKGHPLMWNYGDPKWIIEDLDEVHRLQMARIDDCVKRFTGLIDCWDVVNEATHFDRGDVQKRAPRVSDMWKKYGQVELTRECFEHARQANPKATLLINDYRTDPAYAKLIEQLVDKNGKPLYDVIGIQSHMHGGVWPVQNVWATCERFKRFGVPLHFTEATIVSGERGWEKKGDWPSTPEGEAQQARDVVRFYTTLFSHPSVEAITWWDFSDFQSWQNAPAGLIRKDMTPKPAYNELKRLIKGAWWTTADVTANEQGEAKLTGFLGDYTVTVEAAGKKQAFNQVLKKGENRWVTNLK